MDIDGCHDAHGRLISAATQQLPGQDPAPDPPSTNNMLLNQLVEHYRDSESALSKMAQQINELRQVVVSLANGGAIQGSEPPTVAVDQVANPSNLAPPPTQVPEPLSLCTRRIGPPGTFRNPVPPAIHKDKTKTQFHVSLLSLFHWHPCIDQASIITERSPENYFN